MRKITTLAAAAFAAAVLAVTGSIIGDGSHAQAATISAPHGHAYGYHRHHPCTRHHPCVNPGGPNIPA